MTTVTVASRSLPELPLRSEWTKLWSVRSTFWSLAATVVVSVGICAAATGGYTASWKTLSAESRRQVMSDPIGLILQPGAQFGQLAICVLAVLAVSGEYSTGMIRSSMLAVPRRTPVLAAKAAVLAGVAMVLGWLVALMSFALGGAILHQHVDVGLGDPGVLRAMAGLGLYLAATALIALAVGSLVRHVGGAIAAVVGLSIVAPLLTSLLPGAVGDHISGWMPSAAGALVLSTNGVNAHTVLSPWQGLGVQCLWVAGLLALAVWALRRRDV